MTKTYRQGQILKLIRTRQVFTQDELARELQAVGVPATQVTLSRDIRELGLVKTAEGYQPLDDAETPGPDVDAVVAEYVTDVRVAQNQLVIKTRPAHASLVAFALDEAGWPEVVGTIAGDDTVLVISPDGAAAATLAAKLLA